MRRGIVEGKLLEDGKGETPVHGMRGLDHLVFLPSGDTALTRRSRKYSVLSAVVVRFSRSRGRYERQGLLVESEALERAQQECLSDEEQRQIPRERAGRFANRTTSGTLRSLRQQLSPITLPVHHSKHWRLRSMRARNIAGESGDPLQQRHWMWKLSIWP